MVVVPVGYQDRVQAFLDMLGLGAGGVAGQPGIDQDRPALGGT